MNLANEENKLELNNFYFNMPGEMYRNPAYQNEEQRRLISDLDRIIEETEFDVSRFQEISQETHTVTKIAVTLTVKAMSNGGRANIPQEVHEQGARGKQLQYEREQMIRPLYDQLVAQGYDHEFLIC